LTTARQLHTLPAVKTEEQLDAEGLDLATQITNLVNEWMAQHPCDDPNDEIAVETLVSVTCGLAFERYGWSSEEIITTVGDIANEMLEASAAP
jgi:hypothetical protein